MNNMLYIVWNEYNNLGIPIIDEQHRGIVSTINSFHYFIQEGLGGDALKPTLNILEQYTKIHFRTEEALIREAGYPGLEEHLLLHGELMKRTIKITRESNSCQEPEVALTFLKEWWLGHINKEDKEYAPYVIEKLRIQ